MSVTALYDFVLSYVAFAEWAWTEDVDKLRLYISAQKVEYSLKYKDNLCMYTLWSVS
jgi:hypothetical protein